MAALAADTEAAAGGGREVEKGFAALLRGDGGGLMHSGCSRLLGQRRRGGLLAKSCGGRPHNRGGRARCQPFASGTAAQFIEADSLSLLVWHIYNILGGSLAAPRLLPSGAQPAASFCPQHWILHCFLGFA